MLNSAPVAFRRMILYDVFAARTATVQPVWSLHKGLLNSNGQPLGVNASYFGLEFSVGPGGPGQLLKKTIDSIWNLRPWCSENDYVSAYWCPCV